MIEIALSDVGSILGWMGTIWCFANLGWGLLRNDARLCLIYGIGCFAAVVVMLNVGGVLNERTWTLFGCGVFGLHCLGSAIMGAAAWKVVLYGTLLGISLLSLAGVFG